MNNSRLTELSQELYELSTEIAEREARRGKLRKELFNFATEQIKIAESTSGTLPMKSVVIPEGWLEKIDISKEDFFKSRYPGWIILSEKGGVYIIMKDPEYISWEYVDPDTHIKVAKQIQESTPEIDWKTLQLEDPELFERLAAPVVDYELNEEEYNRVVVENPTVVSILQRHLVMKTPVQRLPKPVKVEDD